jgi:hypothetical protein
VWQQLQDIYFALSAYQLMLSPGKSLAPSLQLEHFSGQKRKEKKDLYVSFKREC